MSLTGDASKARIIAFIIDNLVACLIAFLTVGALHSASGMLSGTVLGVAYLAYFFLFELLWSRTPGKFMQGLVVVSADGNRAGLKAHLIRTLARVFEQTHSCLGEFRPESPSSRQIENNELAICWRARWWFQNV